MDGEVEYIFNEINRIILLLRANDNREKYLNELERNIGEIKRLWDEKRDS